MNTDDRSIRGLRETTPLIPTMTGTCARCGGYCNWHIEDVVAADGSATCPRCRTVYALSYTALPEVARQCRLWRERVAAVPPVPADHVPGHLP